MENLLVKLQGSYFLVPLLVLLVISLIAIYDSFTQSELSILFYLIVAFVIGVISTFIIYINSIPSPEISEEIIKGPPEF